LRSKSGHIDDCAREDTAKSQRTSLLSSQPAVGLVCPLTYFCLHFYTCKGPLFMPTKRSFIYMLLFLKTKAHAIQLREVTAWWEESTLSLLCAGAC